MAPLTELTQSNLDDFDFDFANLRRQLQRIETFLTTYTDTKIERQRLMIRRILGIVKSTTDGETQNDLLEDAIPDLDYYKLLHDTQALEAVVKRFFQANEVKVLKISEYTDPDVLIVKWNVRIVEVSVDGVNRMIILKYVDESYRRECLAMRLHNILTDMPVPFLSNGPSMIQMGLRGMNLDLAVNTRFASPHAEQARQFDFELGKSDEYARMLELSERGGPNNLYLLTGEVQNIDFGSAFSEHMSLRHYRLCDDPRPFEDGKMTARTIARFRYSRFRHLVDLLLSSVDENFVDIANEEDERRQNPIRNPKTIMEDYLQTS